MLDVRKSRQTAFLLLVLSLLALFASLAGVAFPWVYNELSAKGGLSDFLRFGSIAQDLVSLPLAVSLALLSLSSLKRPGPKKMISSLGLAAYFFYGYGLYSMQGQYTSIYPIYLAIFGLAIYGLIGGILSFEPEAVGQTRLPNGLRRAIAAFFLMILLVLVPAWFARMVPDIARHIPGETYAVFILDLAIVFPALGIIAVQLLRARPFGNVLAGIALIKCLTLCLSVAFGQCVGPLYGFPIDVFMITIFALLTSVSAALAFFYLRAFDPVTQPGECFCQEETSRSLR